MPCATIAVCFQGPSPTTKTLVSIRRSSQDGALPQFFEVWGIKVVLSDACWPVALGKSLSHQIPTLVLRFAGVVVFCPTPKFSNLLCRLPDLSLGGGCGLHIPSLANLGLELQTLS
jgi:hypothetical protein